ncbi:MAG TPA: GIY-YIG nuclease family protein [Saprospiraceae bacterium]|nr:GIY-YIG nuclease family protein [Saprospiraceae bacterium]
MKTKKELREEYKLIKFKIGVFQIRNIVNNKIFIDSSVNLDKIWNRHRVELNFGNHRNTVLQKDWKEFGENNFKFEILSEIEQREDPTIDYAREAKLLAQMFIEELQPFGEKGYNSSSG